jgi:ABC-type lipoprotein release transport system permease subunit
VSRWAPSWATRPAIRSRLVSRTRQPDGGGVLLGIAVTTGYTAYQAWPAIVPAWASTGGLAATMLIGGLAGLYPAIRAARLSPTEALATL